MNKTNVDKNSIAAHYENFHGLIVDVLVVIQIIITKPILNEIIIPLNSRQINFNLLKSTFHSKISNQLSLLMN